MIREKFVSIIIKNKEDQAKQSSVVGSSEKTASKRI